jgi:AcrR family transcriptional regulator
VGAKTDRRHQQGEESRQRILDAVISIASERGYEGTTVALVSERSGLPVSSIYWHFGNKDALIAAVIRRSFDAWEAALAEPLSIPEGATRRQALAAILHHDAGSLVAHPEFLRFGLMLALEEREDEPEARRLFLEVRHASRTRIEQGFSLLLLAEGIEDPTVATRLAALTMATVDGLFLARQAEPATADLGGGLELLATALDLLVEEYRHTS